ncbi:MAG: HAD family hydrolase, partial [Phycisphaerales bacterium]
MLQKYRHVIWDWNGTLLDDAWLCIEIINEMLRRRDKAPITRERYMEQFSFPVRDFYERLEFDFSVEPYEAIAREYIKRYDQRCRECRLHDHAMDVLRHCLESGLRQSILSAYHQTRLEGMLDFFELRPLFTTVMGLDDHHAHGKIKQGIRLTYESEIGPGQAVLIG